MAVIAQADAYATLIRKIGYSVGLEELVDRVKQLVDLYVNERAISPSSFGNLVENGFGRKKNASEHFANFYSQLNLVLVIGRGASAKSPPGIGRSVARGPTALEPLYQLDSLSILRRLFESNDDKYGIGVRLVLAQCLIEADGDIFLNGLLSDFEADDMKLRLVEMVQTKRQMLSSVMHTPGLLAKIYRIVDIKNESATEEGARPEFAPQDRFGKRTQSLDAGRRTSPLTQLVDNVVIVPADYIDKVSKTRKGWARDLGLFQEGGKTAIGTRLLDGLSSCIRFTDTTPMAAMNWGYRSDLERLRLNPEALGLGAYKCEAWDLLCAIADAYRPTTPIPAGAALDPDELFELLKRMFALYREANKSKGMIRNSLPLYVAQPVLAAWCTAEARPMPELNEMLETEFHKSIRRIQKMIIRGTSGALFFMG